MEVLGARGEMRETARTSVTKWPLIPTIEGKIPVKVETDENKKEQCDAFRPKSSNFTQHQQLISQTKNTQNSYHKVKQYTS